VGRLNSSRLYIHFTNSFLEIFHTLLVLILIYLRYKSNVANTEETLLHIYISNISDDVLLNVGMKVQL
jgi:hypothetical protein